MSYITGLTASIGNTNEVRIIKEKKNSIVTSINMFRLSDSA